MFTLIRHSVKSCETECLAEILDSASGSLMRHRASGRCPPPTRRGRQRSRPVDCTADRLKKGSSDVPLKTAADTLTRNLSAVEEEIYQARNQSGQDPLNFPIKLNNRLASLLSMVNHGDGKPIGNALPVFKDLTAELKTQTDRLQQVLTRDVAAFNVEAKRLGLEPVTIAEAKKPS